MACLSPDLPPRNALTRVSLIPGTDEASKINLAKATSDSASKRISLLPGCCPLKRWETGIYTWERDITNGSY